MNNKLFIIVIFHVQLRNNPQLAHLLRLGIFKNAGNYSSYCRCVKSERISNDKKKSENNRKNGNHYLACAFMEASNYGIRYLEPIKRYYQRKTLEKKFNKK